MLSATSLHAAAASSAAVSVGFTLLGAGITAVSGLLGVLLKGFLDRGVERRQHEATVQNLRMSLIDQRQRELSAELRAHYGRLLAATHEIYREVSLARQARRDGQMDDAQYVQRLRAISPGDCQALVEETRLRGPADTIALTDGLWTHLRSDPMPRGHDLSSAAWISWKEGYWTRRRALVDACRRDVTPAGP